MDDIENRGGNNERAELQRLFDNALDARDRGEFWKARGYFARTGRQAGFEDMLEDGGAEAMEMAGFGRRVFVDTGAE